MVEHINQAFAAFSLYQPILWACQIALRFYAIEQGIAVIS
jgi:hypothetical protein